MQGIKNILGCNKVFAKPRSNVNEPTYIPTNELVFFNLSLQYLWIRFEPAFIVNEPLGIEDLGILEVLFIMHWGTNKGYYLCPLGDEVLPS